MCSYFKGEVENSEFLITKNTTIDLRKFGNVVSYSLKNQGTTDVVFKNNYNILAGSSMVTFGSISNCKMVDNFDIRFDTGVGSVVMFLQIFTEIKDKNC